MRHFGRQTETRLTTMVLTYCLLENQRKREKRREKEEELEKEIEE